MLIKLGSLELTHREIEWNREESQAKWETQRLTFKKKFILSAQNGNKEELLIDKKNKECRRKERKHVS